MPDSNVFRHGGVEFPLTSSTENSLLRDADPALFYALDFFAAVLRIHIGDRLKAQAAIEGLKFPDIVMQTIWVEPSPFLLATQFTKFPALALYRRDEESFVASATYDRDVSEWEFAYILPSSMSERQLQQLNPILRAVGRVIAKAAHAGFDNGYNGGADIWKLAGIEQARFVKASYGVYEPIDENRLSFRAIVGTLKVVEFDQAADDKLQPLEATTLSVSALAPDDTTVDDVAITTAFAAPQLTTIVPSLGPAAGGSTVTLTGVDFRVDTTMRVTIGGLDCTNVQVLSTTQVQAVTPPHPISTFGEDVVLIADDGQLDTLPMTFSFT